MKTRPVIHALLAGLIAFSACAVAQHSKPGENYRYRWYDNHGQMHFSDSLTSNAIKNGYDVLNSSGLVVQHVQRQLTPEERKAADARQAKLAAQKAAAERQHSQDMQMLNAYPNERVFRDAQQAEVDQLTQSLSTTKINLHAQEQNLAELLAHVSELKHAGKPVPDYLEKRIDTQRAAVNQQRATLVKQQQAKDAAEKTMAERLARYRKIKAEEDAGKL
jgi:uncharacterized protein (DUF488 family)